MYLHAGNNKLIREKHIIGIFDMDTATVSTETKKFLKNAQKNRLIQSADDGLPKSFILYRGVAGAKICTSQISTAVLCNRITRLAWFPPGPVPNLRQ